MFIYFCLLFLTLNASAEKGQLPSAGANSVYNLELGENLLILQSVNKIWIENKKIILAEYKNQKLYIKALHIGESYFRLDNKLYKTIVSPIGSKKTYKEWLQLKSKFIGLELAYCEHYVCLKGKLYRLSDYIKIHKLILENKYVLVLSLETSDALKRQLQNYFEVELRTHAMTPPLIQFNGIWTAYYPKNNFNPKFSDNLLMYGLVTDLKSNPIAAEENIKVAVKIVEVSNNFERKLGVRWPDSYQALIIDNSKFESSSSFEIALNAAEKSGEAKILASPNLICRNGKEADFFAGGEFPIKILGLRSKEIQWKRYGIGLKLKPLIDPLGQMSLQIETEISTLDRSISVDDVPALHSNRVSSYFDLLQSRTIALSGLIKSEVSENTEGLPFLNKIPILGSLFTSKNFLENKSELVIFVTPELMK